ncbi:MAG: RluA family pseudouridine synthase [Patescibacteria group bacterium]
MPTWIISSADANTRLDMFLAAQTPGRSRAAIQKAVKTGQVVIGDKIVTPHRFLKEGDKVVWTGSEEIPVVSRKKKTNTLAKTTPAPKPAPLAPLDIVAETKDWLVINKPIGLLVHPDAKTPHGTLVDLLVAHDPKIGRVGGDPERPGIVHRLDREVSGLMVIAKTQDAFDDLQDQFAQRKIRKTYLALVHGEFFKDEGDIKLAIGRSTSKARMAAKTDTTAGKAAWTHFRVLERFVGATLVELQILSGRTHQIRAHLHGIGHPVIGDQLYTLQKTDRNVQAPRLMLQSVELAFTDPTTHEPVVFKAEPDPTFAALIRTLK